MKRPIYYSIDGTKISTAATFCLLARGNPVWGGQASNDDTLG
jgi:hypothetical protein